MKITTRSSIVAVMAILSFLPGMAGAAVNCPGGIWLSVSVQGPRYVGPGEPVTYTCSINSGTPGGTYIWSIGDFTGPTTGSSVTLTAPAVGGTGVQAISCTYTAPGDECFETAAIMATVLKTGGLVACYPFSGNAIDVSGNGYDGTVVGASLAADRFGQTDCAYNFDGIDDRINLPLDLLNFERTDPFSESFWLKTNDSDGGNNMITKMRPSYLGSSGIGVVLANGILRVHLINTANICRLEGSSVLSDDVWHHVVVTYDGSSRAAGVTVYVDGNLESMTVVSDNLAGTILNSAMPTIGSRNAELYYEGALDDVLIYNRMLDAAEVLTLYNDKGRWDWDGDGLSYQEEMARGTDPFNADSDGDGMADGWEVDEGFNPLVSDGSADADGDGLSNLEEFERGTDPNAGNPTGVLVVMPDTDQYRANEPDLGWTDLP